MYIVLVQWKYLADITVYFGTGKLPIVNITKGCFGKSIYKCSYLPGFTKVCFGTVNLPGW